MHELSVVNGMSAATSKRNDVVEYGYLLEENFSANCTEKLL